MKLDSILIAEHRRDINAKKACAECGGQMPPDRPLWAKFCGEECARRGAAPRVMKVVDLRVCFVCDQVFVAGPLSGTTCSRSCGAKSWSRSDLRYEKICVECGAPFTANHRKGKLCSKLCRSRYHERKRDRRAKPADPG